MKKSVWVYRERNARSVKVFTQRIINQLKNIEDKDDEKKISSI